MDIRVIEREQAPKASRPIGIAGAIFGGAIAFVALGPAVGLLVAGVTLIVILALLQVLPRISLWRLARRRREVAASLVAEAGHNGNAGTITITHSSVVWTSNRHADRVLIATDDVNEVRLSPVSKLFNATRATFVSKLGIEERFTITAPVSLVVESMSKPS